MNALNALCIGNYVIAAAHYVRDGSSGWLAIYAITGAVFGCVSYFIERAALPKSPKVNHG